MDRELCPFCGIYLNSRGGPRVCLRSVLGYSTPDRSSTVSDPEWISTKLFLLLQEVQAPLEEDFGTLHAQTCSSIHKMTTVFSLYSLFSGLFCSQDGLHFILKSDLEFLWKRTAKMIWFLIWCNWITFDYTKRSIRVSKRFITKASNYYYITKMRVFCSL